MGWGTSYITEHYFSKETYNHLYEVEQAIEEDSSILKNIEQQLTSLAIMTEPSKIIPQEEGCDYLTVIPTMVLELLDEYKHTHWHKTLLEQLKGEWDDCHIELTKNEKKKLVGKYPPDEIKVPYLYGDFVETDNQEEE